MSVNIEQILKSIVKDPSSVKYHRNWGYYIQVNFPSIHMIGLIPNDSGQLELSLYFGESQAQSKEFYLLRPQFKHLKGKWVIYPNFHLSNSFRNLFWFKSPNIAINEYVEYWQSNRNLLHRRNQKDTLRLLNNLNEKKIIDFSTEIKRDFQNRILLKDYSQFNICASLGVLYFIGKEEATELSNRKQLGKLLIEKINQGLSIIGEDGNQFLKADPPDF